MRNRTDKPRLPPWNHRSLVSSLVKTVAAMAAMGAANPTVVQDANSVDIDPEFTWEVVNDTCSGSDFDDFVAKKFLATTTEHVEPVSGKTIYLTRFGGEDGGHSGSCNYDTNLFLNFLDLTRDFTMSDTARVYWTNDIEKNAIGLDFLQESDLDVLGVPNGCDFDGETPIDVPSATELTLQFGFSWPDPFLKKINGRPGISETGFDYPFDDSNYYECIASMVIRKGPAANIYYLGTQSNVNK